MGNKKNKELRIFLEVTCTEQRSKNCFQFGKTLRIQTDPDTDLDWPSTLYVSIYEPISDRMLSFHIPADDLEIQENALAD